jgi:sec-independent protein translocase protein TatC
MFWIIASVVVWSVAAYFVQHRIVNVLLKPSHGQHFIYTSPIGGVDFIFRVIIYVGIMMTIPVIIYQLLSYLSPLMRQASAKFASILAAVSGLLALGGILFGYFIGLPAVLHFLLTKFDTGQIAPLLTIHAYMKFVIVYLLGSALMFQVPLIILFINRIKPLKPQKLFKYEKWVIAGSFIFAGLMNPSPNILSLLFVAGPIIATYQIGIGLVWYINRQRKPSKTELLRAEDAKVQAEREQRAAQAQAPARPTAAAQASPTQTTQPAARKQATPHIAPTTQPRPAPRQSTAARLRQAQRTPPTSRTVRPRTYINDFLPERRTQFS